MAVKNLVAKKNKKLKPAQKGARKDCKRKKYARTRVEQAAQAAKELVQDIRVRTCRLARLASRSALSVYVLSDADRLYLLEEGDHTLLNGQLHS